MEKCEEMMRGTPKCSKHEWRHKGKIIGGFCPDFGFCPVGSCSSGGLLSGGLLSSYPFEYIQKDFFFIF